jgi:hypothetical protein
MGRPPLKGSKRRTSVLRIRLTKLERKKLDAIARSNGQDTSTWARQQLLALKKKQKTPARPQKPDIGAI